MSPYLPFLQAIRANPSDDGLRLVFADWLEEHGEPERAEFIRVQVERHSMVWNDPRRTILEQREEEWLNQHRAAWLGPLLTLEPTPSGSNRGTSIELGSTKFWFRRGLPQAFLGPDCHPSPEVLAAPEWNWVEEVGWFDGWRAVEVIRFLTATPLAWCTTLHLGGNKSNRGSEAEVAALASWPGLARVTGLDLGGNQIDAHSAATLAASPHLAQLHTLKLRNNDIGGTGAAALVASPHLGRLTSLLLWTNRIGATGAATLAAVPHPVPLTTLELGPNGIHNAGVAALAASPLLEQVTTLNLHGNQIGNAGAAALAASPLLKQITTLNLIHNQIGNAGGAALAASPYLDRITTLYLHSNHIGKDGSAAQALRERFGKAVHL